MKRLLCTIAVVASTLSALAQGGTNSPYSQYGMGIMADQGNGFSRGMNGVGLGFHDGNQVNYLNPASYASMDSLTFVFDVGMSGQLTNFEENGKRINAKNADFEYAVAGFRAFKHLGMSFGIIPFTNVGYNYANTNAVNDANKTTFTNTYTGSGGLHQMFIGMGWEPFKGFALGVNGSYLWGQYNRSIVNSYSDAYVNTLSKYYTAKVNNYKVDFGAQITFRLSKKNSMTLGLVYGLGHQIGADPECKVISRNSQTSVADTASYVVENGLELPHSFGAGLLFNFDKRVKIGADYTLQQWSKVGFPEYVVKGNQPAYVLNSDYYKDRHKVNIGGEYCKNPTSRKFFDRVRFRAGASYTTPYLNINGKEGPKEISVSAGFGIPIMNVWNARSILNISGQWVNTQTPGMLKENTFRVNVGITFNERWFMKWKVD